VFQGACEIVQNFAKTMLFGRNKAMGRVITATMIIYVSMHECLFAGNVVSVRTAFPLQLVAGPRTG
jgi:hypothetical protein